MDLRDRVDLLARALCHPDGIDLDDWFAPGARLALPAVGLERDLRAVLGPGGPGAGLLPLASCTVEVVRAVRNVVMVNWEAVARGGEDGDGAGGGASGSGRGGGGSAVLSLDRDGLVTHVRVEGALLAAA